MSLHVGNNNLLEYISCSHRGSSTSLLDVNQYTNFLFYNSHHLHKPKNDINIIKLFVSLASMIIEWNQTPFLLGVCEHTIASIGKIVPTNISQFIITLKKYIKIKAEYLLLINYQLNI